VTEISKNSDVVTFINIFTMEPENQQRVVDLLSEVTDRLVRFAKGFVSSSLHRSADGTKVTMYAQWASMEDYQAMREDHRPRPYLAEALTIATFAPGTYDVVETFLPPKS
jgi:quinol monooxygenase YgiN